MLRELPSTQPEAALCRRWFADDDVDLLVWEDAEGIRSFRLCYDKGRDEHAWSWSRDGRSVHERVDTGEQDPLVNRTPVLCRDGEAPIDRLRSLVRSRGRELPGRIRDRIEQSLDVL